MYNTKCNEKSLSKLDKALLFCTKLENKNEYGIVMGYEDKWKMLNCLIEPEFSSNK